MIRSSVYSGPTEYTFKCFASSDYNTARKNWIDL